MRGAVLEFDRLGYVAWREQSHAIAQRAIWDVAEALGYASPGPYNTACYERPDDVRARMEAL